jgi:penicillin-binding protein 2
MFEFKETSQLQRRHIFVRVLAAGVFATLCGALLVWRLWYLQVERYEGLAAKADSNRIAVVPIAPRRGVILDRNGEVLARNYRDYVLEVTPARVPDMERMLEELGSIVELSALQRRRFALALSQSGRYASTLLRNRLSDDEAATFAAQAFRFPGVSLRARWVREYPQGAVAGHVLGHVGRISEADLAWLDEQDELSNYRGSSIIGKKGIEKSWERLLHGQTGLEELEVTASGKPMRGLSRLDPKPGYDLVLSLDIGLQRMAEELFRDRRGALVAIDPRNGEVLALVSAPSFDPNLFVDGIDPDSWRELNESPDHPLVNRPLYSTYPIGSTYKPFVALAALELNKRSATERISDPGYFELGGQRFRNAQGAAYGSTDMRRALVVSSDTYFYSLGVDIGVNALHDFSKQFGFGQITGIDLDGERKGVLPSTDWKRRAYKKPDQQRWYAGESVSVAVGQGYNAFTLLQLAHATSVLANGGVSYRPHLLRATRDGLTGEQSAQENPPTHTIALKAENLRVIREAMVGVIREGTARRAFEGAAYQAAGKTGTAQVYSLRGGRYNSHTVDERLRDHALFMAYAPVESPRIALALIVENAGWGATVAAPIARSVFDYWLSPARGQEGRAPSGAVAAAQQQVKP